MHGEHAHLSPEMTGSPHQNGSGRATPRTTGTGQPSWAGYSAQQPPRQQGSSNVYNVMGDPRPTTNGNGAESYPPNPSHQYPSQGYPQTNGLASLKRSRDDEEEQDSYGRQGSQAGDDIDGLKRRKTITEGPNGPVGGSPYNRNPNSNIRNRPTIPAQQRTGR